MDHETILRLARDAAFHTPVMEGELLRFAALIEEHLKDQGYRQCAKGQRTTQFCGMVEEAVRAEREACAKVCDETVAHHYIKQLIPAKDEAMLLAACADCAAAIRGRNV